MKTINYLFTHPLTGKKLKRVIASNFGENEKQPDSHTLLMGMYNGTTSLGTDLEVSYKPKCKSTI